MEEETNVATFYSAPGYTKFHAICVKYDVSIEDYAPIVALQHNINYDKGQ